MAKGIAFKDLDGSSLRVGLVVGRWNEEFTSSLRDSAMQGLKDSGVTEDNILVQDVPGSFEVVRGAKALIDSDRVDVVICLGVLIKGETMHFEYISEAVSHGIMNMNIHTDVPVIFGILTCLTEEQARARSTGENNHGYMWGKTAVEMGLLAKK